MTRAAWESSPDSAVSGPALIVRTASNGERELTMMRWGSRRHQASATVTNVRNVTSPYWRGWAAARRPIRFAHLAGQSEKCASNEKV